MARLLSRQEIRTRGTALTAASVTRGVAQAELPPKTPLIRFSLVKSNTRDTSLPPAPTGASSTNLSAS
jgi:hypothetical protein